MAQRIVNECDRCLLEGIQTEGKPRQLAFDGPLFIVDLCDAHMAELGDWGELAMRIGRPVGKKAQRIAARPPARESSPPARSNGARRTCVICNKPFGNVQALGVHTVRMHEMTVDQTTGKPTPYACICGLAWIEHDGLRSHLHRLKDDERHAEKAS